MTETLYEKLIAHGLSPAAATSAIKEHILKTGNDSSLTADVLQQLTTAVPVPLPDLGGPVVAPRIQIFAQSRVIAYAILHEAYRLDSEKVWIDEHTLFDKMKKIYAAFKKTVSLPMGDGLSTTLSALRNGKVSYLPTVQTVGPHDRTINGEARRLICIFQRDELEDWKAGKYVIPNFVFNACRRVKESGRESSTT